MNSELFDKINTILPTLYYENNNTYDLNYLNKVLFTSMELLKNLSNKEKIILLNTELTFQECTDIIGTSVLLHKIFDKKYVIKQINITDRKDFLNYYLNGIIDNTHLNIIFNIVDNISFINEIKGLVNNLGKYEILKMIVSDSVKLESMGSDAIDKMIIYNHFNKKDDHSRNIIRHCKQKLFKLKDYIHTSYAKDVAKTFEKQLKLIVSDEIFLSNHINTRIQLLNLNNT